MSTDPMELLSAFVDGEEIDTDRLAEALHAPGAREALLDFARLRAEIERDDAVPGDSTIASIERILARAQPAPWWRRAISVPAPALAAVVVLAVAVAVFTGVRPDGEPVGVQDAAPTADRVLKFEPGVDWTEER